MEGRLPALSLSGAGPSVCRSWQATGRAPDRGVVAFGPVRRAGARCVRDEGNDAPGVDLRSLTRWLAADLLESESLGKKPSRATRKERLPEPGVLAYSARVASSRAPFFSFQLPSRSHFPFTTE